MRDGKILPADAKLEQVKKLLKYELVQLTAGQEKVVKEAILKDAK